MQIIDNKVIVITGAANGLGKALALECHQRGYHLALIDCDRAGLEELQSELPAGPQRVSIHTADVALENELRNARAEIVGIHGRVDILINNAATSISLPFDQLNLKDYKQLIDINLWGVIYGCKYFLPDLKQQPNSRLANIISDFALMGFPGKTTYASSKSAVMGFSNCLYTELVGSTVKLCLVIPPPLDTGIVWNNLHIDELKKEKEALFLQQNGMPLDQAARRIISGIEKGKFRIIIGPMMWWIDWCSRLFPSLLHRLIGKFKHRIEFT